jgi:hypothetical protein
MTILVFAPDAPNDADAALFQQRVDLKRVERLELHPKLARTKPWVRFLATLDGIEVVESRGVATWKIHYHVRDAVSSPPEHAQNRGKQAADVASATVAGLNYILEQ